MLTALVRYNLYTIKFTHLSVHLSAFNVYYTKLCNNHHNLSSLQKEVSYLLTDTPHSPPSQPLVTTNILSVLKDLCLMHISGKRNHIIYGLL